MNEERQEQYFELIDKLVNCPNGKEPDVLDENIELVDSSSISSSLKIGITTEKFL